MLRRKVARFTDPETAKVNEQQQAAVVQETTAWRDAARKVDGRMGEIETWWTLRELEATMNYSQIEDEDRVRVWEDAHPKGFRKIVKRGVLHEVRLNAKGDKISKHKPVEFFLFSDVAMCVLGWIERHAGVLCWYAGMLACCGTARERGRAGMKTRHAARCHHAPALTHRGAHVAGTPGPSRARKQAPQATWCRSKSTARY